MSRKRIVAGNWKMHLSRTEAVALASALAGHAANLSVDVVLFPPFPWLEAVARTVAGYSIEVGGQDCWYQESGANTGQVSAQMLRELCDYVILGHSEHRRDTCETDEVVAKKVAAAMEAGVMPVICVGESAESKSAGDAESFVGNQVEIALSEIPVSETRDVLIAYEPIWAIGSGQSASPEDAETMADVIRDRVAMISRDRASKTRILYGGSVSYDNAARFVDQPNVDGLLVGGASLDAGHFVQIVDSC